MGIKNVIKKDIQNIQSLLFKDDDKKEMYSLITNLERLNYIVKIQVKSSNDKNINGTGAKEVTGLFFLSNKRLLRMQDVGQWLVL